MVLFSYKSVLLEKSMKVIETINLVKEFEHAGIKNTVLDKINISVEEKDFFGVVGPSGSGKTTLIYCLSSLEKITSGKILFFGKDITKYTEYEIAEMRKNDIGFVFQFYNLIPNLTVYENVLLAKVIASQSEDNVIDALEAVDMLEFKDYYPNQISGGMQQRVAIARAIVNNPKIVFADEPTGNLDQKNGKAIMELLKKLNKEKGLTVILVTHNEDYLVYCNKVVNLIDGRVK